MKYEIREIKGMKSLRVMNGFYRLMTGLKMLPHYMAEEPDEFFAKIEKLGLDEKRKLLVEAVRVVALEPEEVEGMIYFATDPNGAPFTANSIGNLTAQEINAIIVEVCLRVGEMKIDIITDAEKKNLNG